MAERAEPSFEVTRLGREPLDLEVVASVEPFIGATRPDVVVNAAAWTEVEGAEPDTAFRVNATGARKVAAAAAALGVPLVHLSTEYVFDGSQAEPYVETDIPPPKHLRAKLAGEKAVVAATDDHVIPRTSWLYSTHGRNFVTKILAQLDDAEIGVVADRLARRPPRLSWRAASSRSIAISCDLQTAPSTGHSTRPAPARPHGPGLPPRFLPDRRERRPEAGRPANPFIQPARTGAPADQFPPGLQSPRKASWDQS